jgi:thiol:disulfide interchange protein DsbD
VTENSRLLPGQTEWIGVTFTMQEDWHIYWPGQNDSGFPAEFEFSLSVEGEVGAPVWPAPVRYFPADGLLDHVYEKQVTILFPLKIAQQALSGANGAAESQEVTISVTADWLVCKEECIPEGAALSLTVPLATPESGGTTTEGALAGPDAQLFEAARQRFPKPWADSGAKARWEGEHLEFTAPGAGKLAFYPSDDSLQVVNLIRHGQSESESLSVSFKEGTGPVRGILEIWDPASGNRPGKSRVYSVDIEQPSR